MEALHKQEKEQIISSTDLTLTEMKRIFQTGSLEEQQKLIELMVEDQRKGAQSFLRQFLKKREKDQAEAQRIRLLWEKERTLAKEGYQYIAGLDEVGRGPLAGPVVAACVILPLECKLPGLNDSKKLSPAEREELAELIMRKAVAWSIGSVDNQEIDRLNILQATKKAMLMAISNIAYKPDYLLIDALELESSIAQEGIIQGDSHSASIAAASILAKTYRDSLMVDLDELYPEYGFSVHKGYGTAQHYEALRQYGPCPIHRQSFLRKFTF